MCVWETRRGERAGPPTQRIQRHRIHSPFCWPATPPQLWARPSPIVPPANMRTGVRGGGGGWAVNSGLSFSPSAHKGAELCRTGALFRVALPWGLNETSVEAEPEGENAILLFNHTDNLFSLSCPPPTTHTHHHHLPSLLFLPWPCKTIHTVYSHLPSKLQRSNSTRERERERWPEGLVGHEVNSFFLFLFFAVFLYVFDAGRDVLFCMELYFTLKKKTQQHKKKDSSFCLWVVAYLCVWLEVLHLILPCNTLEVTVVVQYRY